MNIISVHNLVKNYKSAKKNAVDAISFDVKKGEFFTFLGPNGAGKTTTISILTTTLSKTSGTVKVAGYDTETDANEVRKQIGIIFQKPSLDENLTAEENIRFHTILYGMYPFQPAFSFMPQSYKDKVYELAELLGIVDQLQQPIKTFSGGMKRKLEIIRSLMHQPQVLFLDEPTTGLDPESRKNLWQYLQQVRKEEETTIFLTTHYLEEAEGADTICIINKGSIVAMGSPDKIKEHLVEEYLIINAKQADKLENELRKLNVHFIKEDNFKIELTSVSEVQKLLSQIKTTLSMIEVHRPSLEQAYLEIIERNNVTIIEN